ncbi:piggyBac transposable element-derived protein 4-like [Parasteatoda tepidariorum]|uniref:piggyBac transposable element-derived protein 4-like n=1 Tax=Parasteatoda tepidariorum TaxID=114398 RepID=UPI001C71C554|nr:piggyBac transposable element-derived protein 4-like [Parasteatoda tepidariorum]
MSHQPESSKRPSAMPDRAEKRLKSIDEKELLLNSDDDFYAASDIDDINYEFVDSESDSESEDEDSQLQVKQNNEAVNEELISFNQLAATCWSTDFSSIKKIPFTRTNTLLVPAPNNPRDYFNLFVSEDYLQKIVDCSNRYAENLKNLSNQFQSRITQWKSLTLEELKIFIGLLLHTSSAKIVDYWKIHRLYKSVFPQYMSRNRFQLILRCLYFVDVQKNADHIDKCKLAIDNFNNVMESIYYPCKNLSVGESMILWRGRLIFPQYIKGRRHKYGIKLFALAEPNGTILKAYVLASTVDVISGRGHTEKIVENLLEGKLNVGHAVFMEKKFNSYGLAAKLLEQNTYCTGTLSKKRNDNPNCIFAKKLKKGDNVSQCHNGVHVGKWKDRKEINYISTEFPNKMQEVITRHGTMRTKPVAIINYNKNMSGIDLQDQILSYYPCKREALRWYTKIFIHTLMMSLLNARVLYNKYSNQKSMTLYDFREKIIETYLPEITSDVQTTQKGCENQDQHKLTKIEKAKPRCLSNGKTVNATSRKDCRNCYKNKKRLNTTTECKKCPGSPPLCFDCFFELHNCTAK